MRKKIIIDCDPGHDDAIAILLAGHHPQLDLLGVSVSSGNQTIEKTSQNALNICEYLNIDVPIAPGSSFPLVQKQMICPQIHGESGLDGFDFPKYSKKFDSRYGAQLIIDLVMNNDNVTVITTGPMTNLALAIRLEPRILNHIDEVIFMGGSVDNGNVSPAAEFNILVDPEAAYIVLNSGLRVKMVGLNVTRKVLITDALINRFASIGNRASLLFTNLMRVFLNNQRKTFHIIGAPLHDPVTIASLIDSSLIKFQKMNVQVDLSHGSSYGRTNCDVFDYLHLEPNCEVAMDIDVDKFWSIVEESLKSYSK